MDTIVKVTPPPGAPKVEFSPLNRLDSVSLRWGYPNERKAPDLSFACLA